MSAELSSGVGEQARKIADRVERFVRDEVVPFEHDPRRDLHGPSGVHGAIMGGASELR